MVRLDDDLGYVWRNTQAPFQFQYGAIRCIVSYIQFTPLIGFNSNMVRLDEKKDTKNERNIRLFQFQYGAIRCK